MQTGHRLPLEGEGGGAGAGDTRRQKLQQHPSGMAGSGCRWRGFPMIAGFVGLLLLLVMLMLLLVDCGSPPSSSSSSSSATVRMAVNGSTSTLWPGKEMRKMRRVRAHLRRINKPAIKTIKSPDGDIIDCVASHLQPAFDHPALKGQKPLQDPPERPKGLEVNSSVDVADTLLQFQTWTAAGEYCPEGSVPIRRTTEEDVLRASSVERFGRKPAAARLTMRDSTGTGHEHAVAYVSGEQFYGARASINVWAPKVTAPSEFSLSQMWIIAGSFGNDLNTIEAGWQVSPDLYGDGCPRFFTYWTTDAYHTTGCYNLLCSGFIQTNNKIAIGATISPLSWYAGRQFDISIVIWKDPKHGHWWLEYGPGLLVGYWPAFLFSHLAGHASMVQFGGEVVNTRPYGTHTSTQMGSGSFPRSGFRKAAYFRGLQAVDWDNSLIPLQNLRVYADHRGCYDIQPAWSRSWGNYFYYGGPGKNVRCT